VLCPESAGLQFPETLPTIRLCPRFDFRPGLCFDLLKMPVPGAGAFDVRLGVVQAVAMKWLAWLR
jgi:hypothetical protein